MLDLALILALGVAYPLAHHANGWLFAFAEINSNVALVYLPAFLRLLNVLLLGKFKGTVAGLLGGWLVLLANSHDPLALKLVNMVASSAGPLVAVLVFERWRGRAIELNSLTDLTLVALMCCVANAVLHHVVWSLAAPALLGSPQQVLWMFLGDLIGTLIGAYLLKLAAQWLRIAPRP